LVLVHFLNELVRMHLKCKSSSDDPVERYALPSDEKIEWAFHLLKQTPY
jgi:hypothetical protein